MFYFGREQSKVRDCAMRWGFRRIIGRFVALFSMSFYIPCWNGGYLLLTRWFLVGGYCREATGRGKRRNDRNAWRIERRRLRRVGGGVLLRLRSIFSLSLYLFLPRPTYGLEMRFGVDRACFDMMQRFLFWLQYWIIGVGDCSIHLLEVAGVYNSSFLPLALLYCPPQDCSPPSPSML